MKSKASHSQKSSPDGNKHQESPYSLRIEGMSCASCVNNVERALKSVDGVKRADVNLATSEALVDRTDGDVRSLIRAVEKAGYSAVALDETGRSLEETAMTEESSAASNNGIDSGFVRQNESSSGSRFKKKFWIALPLAIIVFALNMGPMVYPAWHVWIMDYLLLWNSMQLALTAVILFFTGASFFIGAWKSALHKTADMNSLVAIGTGSAFVFSIYAMFFGREGGLVQPQNVYFETAAIIIALILLGKWMEERARLRSRDAMTGLLEMTPQKAHRKNKEGETETISVQDIVVGDRLLVKAWEQVPVDGIVLAGQPSVDESMMTGESIPVEKDIEELVMGGTRNTSTTFEMIATKVGADTVLSRIIRTVREAQNSKPPIQRLVDKVASKFVPIVIAVALVTFMIWWWIGDPAQAMVNMVAVLVIACPCALGLATPTGLMVSSGRAAEKGILIKDAVTLEKARDVDVVMFDKTGTLTSGVMEVVRVVSMNSHFTNDELLMMAGSVEQQSDHPIAESIVRHIKSRNLALNDVTEVETFMGMGIAGKWGERRIAVSNHSAYKDYSVEQQDFINSAQDQGETVLLVRVDEQPAGFITVSDRLRPEAEKVIRRLQEMNIETVMVTGDQFRNAKVMADILGIDHVEAGVKPDEKAEKVKAYQTSGKCVAMVGDGINDAAALVQADLGMALSNGTDLAISSSDVTLLGGHLGKVAEALVLSRKTLRIIRQNLFWAFVYNTLGIPQAAIGF